MKCKNGSFRMHFDGEKDGKIYRQKRIELITTNFIFLMFKVRGAYCAISVASICNILDDELIKNTSEWIQTCQTYEGIESLIFFLSLLTSFLFFFL